MRQQEEQGEIILHASKNILSSTCRFNPRDGIHYDDVLIEGVYCNDDVFTKLFYLYN